MKKLLAILMTLLMVSSLVGCAAPTPTPTPTPVEPEQSTKEVMSAEDFKALGFIIDVPTISGITGIKYLIENNEVARISFRYYDHEYNFAASKTKKSAEMLNIVSVPYNAQTFDGEGITFSLANYEEGSTAAWTRDDVNYALFGKGVSSDDLYGFGMMTAACAGIEIPEEEEVEVEIPENVIGMSKDEIDKFFVENNFLDVDYEYKSSGTIEKEHVISINKTGKVHPYDEIKVYISSGPGEGDTVLVPDNLCGKTESDFVNTILNLKMLPIRLGSTYYSTTIVRGSVYKYDDGKFLVGTEIKYNLSAGPYQFVAEDYNGKTPDQINALVSSLNNLNAHVNWVYGVVETNEHTAGLTYDCHASKDGIVTNVACNLAKTIEDKRVDLPNYVGTYNNPCGREKTCTLNHINYEIHHICDGNPKGYISAQTVNPGKVERGTTVGLTVSTERPYLHRLDEGFYQKYQCDLPDETEEALKQDSDLRQFDTVVFERAHEKGYYGGEVVRILIWSDRGYWVEDYEAGRYPKDTPIRIQIADTLLR